MHFSCREERTDPGMLTAGSSNRAEKVYPESGGLQGPKTMRRLSVSQILVVEDSLTQAQAIQYLLEDAGYTVAQAADRREALAVLARQTPDAILTDLEIPHMNGLELVEAVRRDYPGVPVILMTGLGSEEIAVQALQKGA